MGEKIALPKSPVGWAIHLSKMLEAFSNAHSLARFPIDVAEIAQSYSQSVFPDDPITIVEGQPFSNNFEGALIKNPGKSEWGIFFNSSISSQGRRNFTLAHELGHYLIHRNRHSDGIYCERSDMWTWDSDYGLMEAEANQFASHLLMPRDDFEACTAHFKRPSLVDFEPVKDRYRVSITAAVLRWLEITPKRAMIVVSRDGNVDWAWSSKPLLRSGVYLKPKQRIEPVPVNSVAASANTDGFHQSVDLPAGVWSVREEVQESALFSEYHDQIISLIIYPNTPPPFQPRDIDC